uniref:Sulfotransferase domain-containing protein n=1 Tax=Odontella aurita TaxID=265563 RepID=A0A7S4JMQ5_9STRA|mmetsp:Transcript_4966/g.14227  ORF Transcript_4966/g.14227 Transcript_4966/m.14227 type:complete len:1382 (+) Transcript_4966:235-4380(+)
MTNTMLMLSLLWRGSIFQRSFFFLLLRCKTSIQFINSLTSFGQHCPQGSLPSKKKEGGHLTTGSEPLVTIQICAYNEAAVIEATIDAACSVKWPREKLVVQVLDDSTNYNDRLIAKSRTEHWQKQGVNCQHLTRPSRVGYKAGNLSFHMHKIQGEFVAFFDADHRCEPEFLHHTVPHFFDNLGHSKYDVGLVQAPWAYYNTHETLLTECDSLVMDIHHVLEQQGRANHLGCFSFNGSGGIWRLDAIRAAGGFSWDTVTEDLDLSYIAFMAGYRFVYVPHLPQLLELPSNILAHKQQKNRWNKGYFQVCRKSMQKILKCSHLPLSVRIEAFFHITNPITCFLGLVILFLSPIVMIIHGAVHPALIAFTFAPCISTMVSGMIACYAKVPGSNGHYTTFWDRTKRLVYIPMVMCLAMGTCIYDSCAIFQGLFSNDSTFLRTPKAGGGDNPAEFDLFDNLEVSTNEKHPIKEHQRRTRMPQYFDSVWQEETPLLMADTLQIMFGISFSIYLLIVPFVDTFIWRTWDAEVIWHIYLLRLSLVLPAVALLMYHSSVFAQLNRSFIISFRKRKKQQGIRRLVWHVAVLCTLGTSSVCISNLAEARYNSQKMSSLLVHIETKCDGMATAASSKTAEEHNSDLISNEFEQKSGTSSGYCNWGTDGTSASAKCDGKENGGAFDWCNINRRNCESECGGRWCANYSQFFQCPPRKDISKEELTSRNNKLLKVQAGLKKRGYKENPREKKSDHFLERGYATYESSIWPKPESCQKRLNEDWVHKEDVYQKDSVPPYVKELFNEEFNLVFLLIHKVASTSFPGYLHCEYGPWIHTAPGEASNEKQKIITSVRDPISRFVSATGEVLQRVVNHYCIDHYCNETDRFFGNETIQIFEHQTSWYSLLNEPEWSTPKFLPDLIRSIVNDLSCNHKYYSADHFLSQSVFLSQSPGKADALDAIIKIENSKSGLERIGSLVNHRISEHCSLQQSNLDEKKPGGVPSSKEILTVIRENDDIMRELCLIYIQDYICLDYELPPGCSGLLDDVNKSNSAPSQVMLEDKAEDVVHPGINESSVLSEAKLRYEAREIRLPQILLAGVQKSGSTALAEFLARAGVCFSRANHSHQEKEVHFFDHEEAYSKGVHFYSQKFAHCKNLTLAADATPNTFGFPLHVKNTYELAGKKALETLKIIVVLREPVARELSWYNHRLYKTCSSDGTDNLCRKNGTKLFKQDESGSRFHTFPAYADMIIDKISKITKFTRAVHPPPTSMHEDMFGDMFGLYGDILETWFQHFDRKRILLLSYDELKRNEQSFLQRVFSFLELEVDPALIEHGTSSMNTLRSVSKLKFPPCDIQERLSKAFLPSNEKFFRMLDQEEEGPSMEQRPFPRFRLSNCTIE